MLRKRTKFLVSFPRDLSFQIFTFLAFPALHLTPTTLRSGFLGYQYPVLFSDLRIDVYSEKYYPLGLCRTAPPRKFTRRSMSTPTVPPPAGEQLAPRQIQVLGELNAVVSTLEAIDSALDDVNNLISKVRRSIMKGSSRGAVASPLRRMHTPFDRTLTPLTVILPSAHHSPVS